MDNCANCKLAKDLNGVFECRRNPPQILVYVNQEGQLVFDTRWPIVGGDDWCGEHEAPVVIGTRQ